MPWSQEEIDAEMDDGECPYCGGEGVIEGECTCGDDTCCCLEPDPPPCPHCSQVTQHQRVKLCS